MALHQYVMVHLYYPRPCRGEPEAASEEFQLAIHTCGMSKVLIEWLRVTLRWKLTLIRIRAFAVTRCPTPDVKVPVNRNGVLGDYSLANDLTRPQ